MGEKDAGRDGGREFNTFQTGLVVVASGECGNSDDDVSESSGDYIAEEIVGHVGDNKSRKYIVRWQGYVAGDTTKEPPRKFGRVLSIELLVKYLSKHHSAKQGRPGHKCTLKSFNSSKYSVLAKFRLCLLFDNLS